MRGLQANGNTASGFGLRPVRPGVVAAILGFLGVFLVAPACWVVWVAFCPDQSARGRWLLLALATVLLALPGRVAWVAGRRRLRSGRWSASEEERLELRRRWAQDGMKARMRRIEIGFTVLQGMVAILWLWADLRHAPHGGVEVFSLVCSAAYAAMTAWSIRTLFRRRKDLRPGAAR